MCSRYGISANFCESDLLGHSVPTPVHLSYHVQQPVVILTNGKRIKARKEGLNVNHRCTSHFSQGFGQCISLYIILSSNGFNDILGDGYTDKWISDV